jgi:hypothetical protein
MTNLVRSYLLMLSLCATFLTGPGCADDAQLEAQPDAEVSFTDGVKAVGVETDNEQSIGAGCRPSHPDYPRCARGDGPTIPGPSCTGFDGCYWLCGVRYPCATDELACDPLGDCLTSCDIAYPGC